MHMGAGDEPYLEHVCIHISELRGKEVLGVFFCACLNGGSLPHRQFCVCIFLFSFLQKDGGLCFLSDAVFLLLFLFFPFLV